MTTEQAATGGTPSEGKAFSINTDVGLYHFSIATQGVGTTGAAARMHCHREDEAGAISRATPDDIGFHLCAMLVEDLLHEEQQKAMSQSPGFTPSPSTPTVKGYSMRFGNSSGTAKTIGITVCPFRQYTVVRLMPTAEPVQPATLNEVQEKVTFKEPVVLTDADTGCCHDINSDWGGEAAASLKQFFAETDPSQINAVIGENLLHPPNLSEQ